LNEVDEVIAVVRTREASIDSNYTKARQRHAELREEAYEAVRADLILNGLCGPDLRLADIDEQAIDVWRSSWTGMHPSRAGGWNWSGLVEQMPSRAATLPIAIWYGTDLCGLACGYASRHRRTGARHTVTLTHVERRPEPPRVPLRRLIIPLAAAAAESYGRALHASVLRLRHPDQNLLGYYQEVLGVQVVWKNGRAVYCEKRIPG
jgi:hypothetical protein